MHERSCCCWVAVLPPSLSRDGGGNCCTTIRACSCSCPYCSRSFFVLLLLSNCYALGAAIRSSLGLVRAAVLILPQLVRVPARPYSLFSLRQSAVIEETLLKPGQIHRDTGSKTQFEAAGDC
ncbi:uncharacterized protein LOC130933241 isoform X2 [Arachis stenosperma]|uniref:uncharacterized protein LOC130933241 isoform X2 n=1 Tax=Arachis stenosperma TaxID=217475 RepID=UPI0025AB615F|nr:uncharacterized protein LOC130933241 isoform X2 [Arachis stenosperma]